MYSVLSIISRWCVIQGTTSGSIPLANVPRKCVVCRRETYAPDVFIGTFLKIGPLIKQTKMTLAFHGIISNSNHTEVAIALLFELIFSDVFNPMLPYLHFSPI